MRIVVDMQGAQSDSRFRGIGRYSFNLARSLVRNRGRHEVILALSGLLPETIESIRYAFHDLLAPEQIRVWMSSEPLCERAAEKSAARDIAELTREAFLESLNGDVIIITSLFEGFVDNAVTSIGLFDRSTPACVVLYDLIPLCSRSAYLDSNPAYAKFYEKKLAFLKRASLFLAISDSTRSEALEYLGLTESAVVNISSAADERFSASLSFEEASRFCRSRFQIVRPFVLYTGGSDARKNLPRLIEAFSTLPSILRNQHQLVLAGWMGDEDVVLLRSLAKKFGLDSDGLIITGYVTDDELVKLYHACKLYVFPSWHEGFGLPVLEAMACGAPVIGSNVSSLPEVIGLEAALFDPFDVTSITKLINKALTDDAFREQLVVHGERQVRLFSWDITAKKALSALERFSENRRPNYFQRSTVVSKLYDAIVPSLVNLELGAQLTTASYLAQNYAASPNRQLLVDVSELSQRDAATGVQRVVRNYLYWLLSSPPDGFDVEPVFASQNHGYRYARGFTLNFLGQKVDEAVCEDEVRWQAGDVFFGLDMQHHVQLANEKFYEQLRLDGVVVKFLVYDLLPIQLSELFRHNDAAELHARLMKMFSSMDGVICISEATSNAYRDWARENGISVSNRFQNDWLHIGADISPIKSTLDYQQDSSPVFSAMSERLTFLSVSTLEPRKSQGQILDAFELLWKQQVDVNIVFVGNQGWKVESLVNRINTHPEIGRRLFWLKGITDEYLDLIYASSTCLIAASLNEGFGLPLIEAAEKGLSVIARDIPVFREVAGDGAFYFSGQQPENLAKAVRQWLGLWAVRKQPNPQLIKRLSWQQSAEILKRKLVVENYRRRQLLVDVSSLVEQDVKTGIQRVVRSVLMEWLQNPPDGFRVEPVYATVEQGYRYAKNFTVKFFGDPSIDQVDEYVDVAPGDLFIGLDLNHHVPRVHQKYLKSLCLYGVDVRFVVYDLIPVQHPEFWESKHRVDEVVSHWLSVIAGFSGVVCISKSVAAEFRDWISERSPEHSATLKIDWFHLGADIVNSKPSVGLPTNGERVLDALTNRASFLMVGTLEPRKGHAQVLDAFEQMWREGNQINLVIVGKAGWMVDDLVARLQNHPKRGKRLFWLEAISDEYLEKVYAASSCLIAASFGEGFGLPLIEAAQHKLPIIARDIPVFREVASSHAYYFSGDEPQALAKSIRDWLVLYESNQHPKSDDMPWLTWKESVQQLNQKLFQPNKLN